MAWFAVVMLWTPWLLCKYFGVLEYGFHVYIIYMLFAIVFIARSLCFMELDVLVRGGRVGWSEALLLKYSPGWVT